MKIIVIRNIRTGHIHMLPFEHYVDEDYILDRINESFNWTHEYDYEIAKIIEL